MTWICKVWYGDHWEDRPEAFKTYRDALAFAKGYNKIRKKRGYPCTPSEVHEKYEQLELFPL